MVNPFCTRYLHVRYMTLGVTLLEAVVTFSSFTITMAITRIMGQPILCFIAVQSILSPEDIRLGRTNRSGSTSPVFSWTTTARI
jgi:hypothetical protein